MRWPTKLKLLAGALPPTYDSTGGGLAPGSVGTTRGNVPVTRPSAAGACTSTTFTPQVAGFIAGLSLSEARRRLMQSVMVG